MGIIIYHHCIPFLSKSKGIWYEMRFFGTKRTFWEIIPISKYLYNKKDHDITKKCHGQFSLIIIVISINQRL